VAFTAQQPKDGDTIMHCGHVEGCMHWFQYDRAIRFQRPDKTHGESSWFAACDACVVRHGEKVMNYVRGDATWSGDAPTIEEVKES